MTEQTLVNKSVFVGMALKLTCGTVEAVII